MTQDEWFALMSCLGFARNQDTYDQLGDAYREGHRAYHTQHHINAMLKHFESSKHLAARSDLVELAIWFHDAIYKPTSSNNERVSADWAVKFMTSNHANKDDVTLVEALIMATLHTALPENTDAQLLVDIDLTILGSTTEEYSQFERNVRKEYKWVPSFVYKKKRKEVLQGFLNRDRIYSTAYFYEQFEQKARENICEAIFKL